MYPSRSSAFTFSIIIATYNRARMLERCLEAVAQQEYEEPFEVIVVDDGSSVPPYKAAASFAASLNLRLFCQRNQGPGSARNTGAAAARGSYLVFVDDDCIPHPGWLAALRSACARDSQAMIGGPVVNMLGDNPYAEATQLIMTFMREGPATESATSKLLTANNMTVPKEIFLDMGGFERGLRYGEDRYFCHRWRLAGRPIVVDPDALVFHEHDLGLCDFWKLHVQYGSGSAAARRFLAQRENVPYRLEPWRTYWHLLAFPFKVNNGFRAWSTAGLVLAAQLATAEGTIQDRVRHRGRKDGVF